ncbi:MAG: ABC transporter ATP-binding protein/permease [Eubacterium sp.]|nr:ABC transporter ATP-binding protein/permease [Eubacterium sp.]
MSSKYALKSLGVRLKKYRVMLAISIILSFLLVVATLYVPKIIGQATDHIIGKGKVEFGEVSKTVIQIVVIVIFACIVQWIMGVINNKITFNLIRDIRQETFCKIQKLPLKYIDRHSKGELISKIITDVDQLADGLLMGFTSFFSGVITILLTLVFMLLINWKVALVVIVLTPLSIFIAKFIAKHTYEMFKKQSEVRAEQTAIVEETVKGAKLVKAFSREDSQLEKFDETNERLEKCYTKATFYSSLTNPCTRFANNIIYAGVAVCGGLVAVLTGGITVGSLMAILTYATQYMKPFNEISGVITELQNALASAGRVFELIDEEVDIVDEGKIVLDNPEGKIEVEHLNFSYEYKRGNDTETGLRDEPKKILNDVNLEVEPGETIAIVGETGAGKTTFVNLLMRFYELDSGSIKIDGVDITDMTRESLRSSFGMVLQDTWVRNATIRDNIKFAKPNASDEEMLEACKECHAHNFISKLPDGYDTMVSEDGENLSQGQKQLLCIARLMLDLPPMLILDEATSSIDTRTEMRIQRAFEKMMNGRTTFIVAHRLSTIQNADKVLEMKDGTLKIKEGV